MSARLPLPCTLAGALTGALAAAAGAPAVAGGIEASYSADMWMPDRSDFDDGGVVKHLAQPGSNTKPLKTPCLILFHRGAMGYSPNTQPIFASTSRKLAERAAKHKKKHGDSTAKKCPIGVDCESMVEPLHVLSFGDVNCLMSGDAAPETCGGTKESIPRNPQIRLFLDPDWQTFEDGILFERKGESHCNFEQCPFKEKHIIDWVFHQMKVHKTMKNGGGFSKLPMEQTHPEATKVVEIDLDAEQTKAGAPLGSPMAAWSEADVGNWVGSVPRLRPSEVELIRAALHHAEIDGHELAALRRKPLRALLRGAGLDDHTPPGDRPWEGASLTTIVACVGDARDAVLKAGREKEDL